MTVSMYFVLRSFGPSTAARNNRDSDVVQKEQVDISLWPEITIDVCDVEEVQNNISVIIYLVDIVTKLKKKSEW